MEEDWESCSQGREKLVMWLLRRTTVKKKNVVFTHVDCEISLQGIVKNAGKLHWYWRQCLHL